MKLLIASMSSKEEVVSMDRRLSGQEKSLNDVNWRRWEFNGKTGWLINPWIKN